MKAKIIRCGIWTYNKKQYLEQYWEGSYFLEGGQYIKIKDSIYVIKKWACSLNCWEVEMVSNSLDFILRGSI